jgi:hypothetical protein
MTSAGGAYIPEEMNNPYSPPGAPMPQYPYAQPAAPGASGGVSDGAIEMLRLTRPWVQFMSVMCFLGAGLMLLASLSMFVMGAFAGAATSAAGKPPFPFPMAMLGLVYLPLALIYIYPGLKLWKYGASIGRMLTSRSTVDLEAALGEQKSFWKYAGIVTIVLIAFYILLFAGLMVAGVAGALSGTSGT